METSNQKMGLPGRIELSFKSSKVAYVMILVIGVVATILELLILGLLLFGGPGLYWPAAIGMVIVPLVALVASGSVLAYDWLKPSKEPSVKSDIAVRPPSSIPPARISPISSKSTIDPILGIWYSRKHVMVIFHPNGTYDMADASRKGQADAYVGGTFRKEKPGCYNLHPEIAGLSQADAQKITFPAVRGRQLFLQGSRLHDVQDSSIEFFRYDEGKTQAG